MSTLADYAALYRQRELLPLRTRLGVTFGAVACLLTVWGAAAVRGRWAVPRLGSGPAGRDSA